MAITHSLLNKLFSKLIVPEQAELSWIRDPQKQSALLRKIIDRIRNSLELKVVLQTAVDEVATLIQAERCCFLWYYSDTRRVQVVCEKTHGNHKPSLGYYPLENFGAAANALAQASLFVNYGLEACQERKGVLHRLLSCLQTTKTPQKLQQTNSGHQTQSVLGAQASLLVPVKSQSGRIGFIACLCERPRKWSVGEIEFLQSLAQQLEIAIRQAQLYEQTEKQAQQERLINQITTQTRQSLNLETILTEAISQLMQALAADRCLVHLVEEPCQEPHSQSQPEELPEIPDREKTYRRKHLFEVCQNNCPPSIEDFDTHGPITEWVIEHRELVVIPDITQDPRIGPNNPEYQRANIKSSLVVPVQANGRLYAILYINQCSYIRYWSKNDQKLAQAVADQLAISIHQAHLYAQARAAAAKATAQAQQLSQLLHDLQQSQAQLIQTEKMSSLGQLVAGIAHEINNPVNFIYGNLTYAHNYIQELLELVRLYQKFYPNPAPEITAHCKEIDFEFLCDDLPKLLKSMKMGAERIREIVLSLRNFSRIDQADMKLVDLHEGIENTLLILHNRIKGKAGNHRIKVVKEYGNLPLVECYPGQLNQVFMNIISNSIDAIESYNEQRSPEEIRNNPSQITIRTELEEPDWVIVRISDNGPGMSESVRARLFDPFFTTKPVGKGTGLGLSISYQIVVQKHGGMISCHSELGKGTEFCVKIPLRQAKGKCVAHLPAVSEKSTSNVVAV
ncbi:MAG: GAF domain-containing sensor histidine kinase [Oscillatoriaceae bacterium SKW80]|nr:GAF domain-containing sensor histidine kinase [Oscillatoriaceae bacterium SKYG93]MCX8122297.1 GAF domain-containing sensor histidine kinase [Oscillatoriaceae bacterium SKW80]MDW8452512.1 GAF domain-containing protein [Oscillatoriaceae cyanobacterium SKYGB_i_bin93]HIK29642.1 GAF domain-containing sensor histidine kinase [Oscillatoriaceae cyanobacterium M7585_C2015_266]